MAAFSINPQFSANRVSFLRLPMLLRTRVCRPSARQFHATPSPAFGLSVLTPEGLLTGLHATGLSWAYVIPIAATVVRLGTFFAFQFPGRRAAQRRMMVLPAEAALRFADLRVSKPDAYESERRRQEMARLRGLWGAPRWMLFISVAQLPIFLAMIETIRKMLGMKQGAWAYLKQLISNAKDSIASMDIWGTAVQARAAEQTTTDLPSSADPSWTVEGPWWCADLTALDQTHFLPVAIPILMLLTVTVRPTPGALREASKPRMLADRTKIVARGFLRRLLIALCVGMSFVTPHLPAGLLWYWFWSTGTALVTTVLTDKLMPIPRRDIATRPHPPYKPRTARAGVYSRIAQR